MMHSYVARTAWQQPYLMHMVLAVASAHLRRLVSSTDQPKRHSSLVVADVSHWQTGLELYRCALSSPANDVRQQGDALVSTTFIAVLYAFALGDEVAPNAYSLDYDCAVRNALSPMAAASGMAVLRSAFGVPDLSTAWRAVLLTSDDRHCTFTCQDSGVAGIPPAFVDLCGLEDTSTPKNNAYHAILRHLSPLLIVEPSNEHFVRLISFGARTFHNFRLLLEHRDTKALLLLSYWFALLSRLNQWYVYQKTEPPAGELLISSPPL